MGENMIFINICLIIFAIIGLLLIYSGISGMLMDITRKRKIRKRRFVILILGILVDLLCFFGKENIFIEYLSIFFAISFVIFLIANIGINFVKHKKEYNALIVLGGILRHGYQLSDAVKRRLDSAIKVYKKQSKKPKIIVSGGMIRKQELTEAEAMKKYLIEKGINEPDIIEEGKSKNTLENFKFSKEILDNLKIKENIAFVSNNFHILRSKIYSRKVGMKANGISAKTRWYYYFDALMNEYLALIVLYKWIFIIYLILEVILIILI